MNVIDRLQKEVDDDLELLTFINKLVADNTKMNKQLNELSDLIVYWTDQNLELQMTHPMIDISEICKVLGQPTFREAYDEQLEFRKGKRNECLSEISKDTESVICSKRTEE